MKACFRKALLASRQASPTVQNAALAALSALLAGSLLAGCGGGGGGGGGSTPPPTSYLDANAYSTAPLATLGTPNEITATSHGQSTVGSTSVSWTATAGHLTALDPTSQAPEASFFYVAYTADGAAPATRPVTFFFNGGPGSASAWLHLGSFAPKRLDTGVPATSPYPRDFPYVVNAQTLIDTTDLVYVDAVGTGLSEAVGGFKNNSFWGVDVDAVVMRDFIERWLAVQQRQASPLYVYGESYGTVRGPLVVKYLEMAGVPVTGLVLQSSILDYNSNCGVTTASFTNVSCAGQVPSYAAVGDYLGLVKPPPSDLFAFLDQVGAYTDSTYQPAVATYLASRTLPPSSVTDTLAADTGLPAAKWQGHFNMDAEYWRHNIVPGSVAGLYDGRIVAPAGSALDANDEPSDTLIDAGFSDAIGTVLADIGYTNPSTYVMLSDAINGWNFSHAGQAMPDVVPDLATALTLDPNLKVLSLNGVHDLITPYHQTELDLARLASGQLARVAFRRYPGGHMTYLDDDGRVGERADLGAFYAGTLPISAQAVVASARHPASERSRADAASARALEAASTFATLSGRPAAHPLAVQAPVGPHRDPGLPPLAAREAVRTAPGASGAALDALVAADLKAQFDRADTAHRGRVTAAEARAAGLGALANRFDDVDAQHRGSVSFDDWMRALRSRGGAVQP
jgi:carboxypeptidase C (cathepsin A)